MFRGKQLNFQGVDALSKKNSKMVVEEIFRQSLNVLLVGVESLSNGRLTAIYTNSHLLFTVHIYHVHSNYWRPYVTWYI